MLKRIGFFLITNLVIVLSISLLLKILGVGPYLTPTGLDLGSLAVFCLVWGMAGSLISLALSRAIAKWSMGVQVLKPTKAGQLEWLVNLVHQLSQRAALPAMPEVGIYESPDVNAFATGPSKSRSLVAVSTGLLQTMNRNEIEGVLAHEVAHIQNGDMVTMTLLQGVVNAFVMFFARIIAFAIAQSGRGENDRATINHFTVMILEIVLGLVGMLIVSAFSRAREFRADAGSAKLAGKGNMVAALQALARIHHEPVHEAASIAPYKISGKEGSGLSSYFSFATHPPLAERIAALQRFA